MKKTIIESRITRSEGFTLIEVLVVVAVVGIMMTLASVIFINTIRSSKKSEITAEARENAALVIDRMQVDARYASTINVLGDTITISGGPNGNVTWVCNEEINNTTNGSITRNGVTATNQDPVDGVSVTSCTFTKASTNDLIVVEFTISEGASISGPQEYGVSLPFKTSISKRSF